MRRRSASVRVFLGVEAGRVATGAVATLETGVGTADPTGILVAEYIGA